MPKPAATSPRRKPHAEPWRCRPTRRTRRVYTAAVDMKQSQSFRLQLTDDRGRREQAAAPSWRSTSRPTARRT